MSTKPNVRYKINNEFQENEKSKAPPIASKFSGTAVIDSGIIDVWFTDNEEFELDEFDEIDGEFTPLTNGYDEDTFAVARKRNGRKNDVEFSDPNGVRQTAPIPNGYFPQGPSYYPGVSFLS